MKPIISFLAAALLIVLWVVLAFVEAIPSGWVHLPLAAGATLVAIGIIETKPAGSVK